MGEKILYKIEITLDRMFLYTFSSVKGYFCSLLISNIFLFTSLSQIDIPSAVLNHSGTHLYFSPKRELLLFRIPSFCRRSAEGFAIENLIRRPYFCRLYCLFKLTLLPVLCFVPNFLIQLLNFKEA